MAISAEWYGLALKNLMDGSTTFDWDTDTIKVALLSSAYTPNQDTHDFFDDVSANEITGTGYSSGGFTLSSCAVSYDSASNEIRLDAADIVANPATFTARYAVVYKDTGTASTSPLLGLIDFGADESPASASFTISWSSSGVLKLTV